MLLLFTFYLFLFTSNNLIESFIFNKLINRFNNKINFDQNNKKHNQNKYLILNKQNKFYDHKNITQFIILDCTAATTVYAYRGRYL